MTRKQVSGNIPAEIAERMTDNIGWGDSRAAELSYSIWMEEEIERNLKDSGWWLDVMEGKEACDKIAFCLSEIYRNLGNQQEIRDQLSALMNWAYKTAQDEVEDR